MVVDADVGAVPLLIGVSDVCFVLLLGAVASGLVLLIGDGA